MMRAVLLLLAFVLLAVGASAQDFQSPEILFKKAYDSEYPHDPNKLDLDRAIDYYGRALERAETLLDRETGLEQELQSEIRIAYFSEWAVKSLAARARCYEQQEPPNEGSALSDYETIVSSWKDRAPEKVVGLVTLAETKKRHNGVDIWLNRFARQVEQVRRGNLHADALKELKEETWGQISGKDIDGQVGLIENLNHPEKQVRSLVADKLQLVCDEDGIVLLIEKLATKTHRAGAGTALRAIVERYERVRDLEAQANRAEFRLKFIPSGQGPFQEKVNDLTSRTRADQVDKIRGLANQERKNLPKDINTPRVFQALSKVIPDTSLDSDARTEALKVLTAFAPLQSQAVELLLGALDDPNDRVREAAAIACSKVNTRKSEDKHALADKLMALVQYEPVNDQDLELERIQIEQETHPELKPLVSKLIEWQTRGDAEKEEEARNAVDKKKDELVAKVAQLMGNTDISREKAAISLGKIGVIKAIPALVEALDDNAMIVRRASHKSLLQICAPLDRVRDGTKELPFAIPYDPGAPRSSESKQARLDKLQNEADNVPSTQPEHSEALQASIQALQGKTPFQETQGQWKKWWETTRGVEILVTRFDTFVREWGVYNPKDVYDEEGFRIKVEAKARFAADPELERQRAEAVIKEFREDNVNFMIQDLIDATAKANNPRMRVVVLTWLHKYLDGKVEGQTDTKEVTQMFVGECLSNVIVTPPGSDQSRENIRNILLGNMQETPERKAGAAFVAAYYPREQADIDLDRTAAEMALRDGDARVRLAACYASGKIGNYRTMQELVGKLRDEEPVVRHAAARAIGRIARHAATKRPEERVMDMIGERISHETDDPTKPSELAEPLANIREEVCFAFGYIGSPLAFKHLIRARRDFDDRVRYAASVALERIGKKEPQAANLLWKMYEGEGEDQVKFTDRQGAILAIGDVKAPEGVAREVAVKICQKLTGSGEAPWRVWDRHQRVRRACAIALGNMGYKSPQVRAALEGGLVDPAPEVRAASYQALNKLAGGGLSTVKRNISFKTADGGREQREVAFMGKLPIETIKNFANDIKAWLDINARDTFTQPD